MIELRQVNCGDGSFRLEQRTRNVTCDASGAFAGFTEWSEWGPVPTVGKSDQPIVDSDLSDLTDLITNTIDTAIRESSCSSYWDWQDLIFTVLKQHFQEQ